MPSLWHALTGEGEPYASGPTTSWRWRRASGEGVLRGGCLSLLAAAAGTPWALRSVDEPTILFVEDVDEPPYRVDRMLRQLRASGALAGGDRGRLRRHEGLRPGLPRGLHARGGPPRGALAGLDVPVALGLSSGHTAHPNVTLPLGRPGPARAAGAARRASRVLEAPVE